MKITIQNARLIDPKNRTDELGSLWLSDGFIVAKGVSPPNDFVVDSVIDVKGCLVCPGFIDLGARLNSIEAELAAAVAGGVTTVVVPPDTDPPLDEPELADRLVHRARDIGKAKVLPLGALTLGLRGERLAELAGLSKAGCIAFSQANRPIIDTEALLKAMEYAATFGFSVWLQAEDHWLSRNGFAHDGETASRLGLATIPVTSETIAIATLLQLAQQTGVRLHLTRLSSAKGVEMLKLAQKEGMPVSFDVGIHHLLMNESHIGYFDTNARFSPPLRTENDRLALSLAVAEGAAALCSDHTPVGADDKLLPFGEAKSGATGLELLLPLTLRWAKAINLPLPTALARISSDPAVILGVAAGELTAGSVADIVIFDPEERWCLNADDLKSRGKNSPWLGEMLEGRIKFTLVGGRVVYQDK